MSSIVSCSDRGTEQHESWEDIVYLQVEQAPECCNTVMDNTEVPLQISSRNVKCPPFLRPSRQTQLVSSPPSNTVQSSPAAVSKTAPQPYSCCPPPLQQCHLLCKDTSSTPLDDDTRRRTLIFAAAHAHGNFREPGAALVYNTPIQCQAAIQELTNSACGRHWSPPLTADEHMLLRQIYKDNQIPKGVLTAVVIHQLKDYCEGPVSRRSGMSLMSILVGLVRAFEPMRMALCDPRVPLHLSFGMQWRSLIEDVIDRCPSFPETAALYVQRRLQTNAPHLAVEVDSVAQLALMGSDIHIFEDWMILYVSTWLLGGHASGCAALARGLREAGLSRCGGALQNMVADITDPLTSADTSIVLQALTPAVWPLTMKPLPTSFIPFNLRSAFQEITARRPSRRLVPLINFGTAEVCLFDQGVECRTWTLPTAHAFALQYMTEGGATCWDQPFLFNHLLAGLPENGRTIVEQLCGVGVLVLADSVFVHLNATPPVTVALFEPVALGGGTMPEARAERWIARPSEDNAASHRQSSSIPNMRHASALIDAALVRAMKRAGSLSVPDLLTSISIATGSDPELLKNRLLGLIDRDYVIIDENNICIYLP